MFCLDDHPDDWDFRPALSLSNNEFIVSDIISGNQLASIELSDEESEVIHRDRVAELRVKFRYGMHGRLQTINPIIADGKAKNLQQQTGKPLKVLRFCNNLIGIATISLILVHLI